MTTKISTIIIGAGSGALAAANYLNDNGFSDFLILEKGNSLRKRTCPGVNEKTCKFCSESCFITEGVGGANALFGNKICYFPASSDNLSVYCDKVSQTVVESYLNKFKPFIDSNNCIEKKVSSVHKKDYFSDVLSRTEYGKFIEKLSSNLLLNQKIKHNTEVVFIEKRGNEFLLTDKNQKSYSCKNLILAGGRSSHTFLAKTADELGIKYSFLTQDVGFRIESNNENFSPLYYYQVDPKFKMSLDGIGSARTFCAHNQGLVVPVQFGRSFFADGAFGTEFSKKNNVAFMARIDKELSNYELERWCAEINKLASMSLILGEVDLQESNKEELINRIFSVVPFYPTPEHGHLMYSFIEKLLTDENYRIFNNSIANPELRIYGPSIDRYWIQPQVDDNFQSTSTDNCFIIGDALGLSRGIFQAMYSGVLWAHKFIRLHNKLPLNDQVWSSRLSADIQ